MNMDRKNLPSHQLSPTHLRKERNLHLAEKLETLQKNKTMDGSDSELSDEIWNLNDEEVDLNVDPVPAQKPDDFSSNDLSTSSDESEPHETITLDIRDARECGSVSTLLLYEFFLRNHGKVFSERMMAWILRFISNEQTSKSVAPTMYLLKQSGVAMIPNVVCYQFF